MSIFIPSDEAHREMREHALIAFADVRRARRATPDPPPPSALARALAFPVGESWRQRSYAELLRDSDQRSCALEFFSARLAALTA